MAAMTMARRNNNPSFPIIGALKVFMYSASIKTPALAMGLNPYLNPVEICRPNHPQFLWQANHRFRDGVKTT